MITWPDFTFPPINLWTVWPHPKTFETLKNETLKTQKVKETKEKV